MPLNFLVDTGNPIPVGQDQPDVQDTTFAKDLSRLICNTLPEALTNSDFDAIVIGSGMYGAYCAAKIFRLSEKHRPTPLHVLVLEAGPFLASEHLENQPNLAVFAPGPIDTREAAKTPSPSVVSKN